MGSHSPIAAHQPFIWTPDAVAMLGKRPDKEVAKTLGLSTSSVYTARTKRGIPANRMGIIWGAEQIRLLGTDTDSAVAKQLGVKPRQVERKRRELKIEPFTLQEPAVVIPPEFQVKLGKVSDGIIAEALGYSQPAVSMFRRKLGIPAITEPTKPAPLEMDAELGKDSDVNIAKRYGVSHTCVWRKRKQRGIPRFNSGN